MAAMRPTTAARTPLQLRFVRGKHRCMLVHARQIRCDVVEESPVLSAEPADVAAVDSARLIVLTHRCITEQGDHIAHVLLLKPEDLQLGKEEVAERDGVGLDREAPGESDVVVHAESVEEDVDMVLGMHGASPSPRHVRAASDELHFLTGRRRPHLVVLGVSKAGEQRGQVSRLLRRRDHVEVRVVTLAQLVGPAVFAHGQSAEQAQGDAPGTRCIDQPAALVQHLVLHRVLRLR